MHPTHILLVKLGALGDVLRTTPLLTALKTKYPGCRITWVVDSRHRGVLEGNALIGRLLVYSKELLPELGREDFDLAINLDKDDEALDTVMAAKAARKMGFGRAADGKLCALDALSDYAYRLGIDDELKFRQNKKTYQEISFEQAGLRFNGEDYLFHLHEEDLRFAKSHLKMLGVQTGGRPVIGLNTGSGNRFAGKKLPIASYVELARELVGELDAEVLLLGGEDEIERNRRIQELSVCTVFNTGSHSINRFAAIVKQCSAIITGDTTAMHIAIATRVPVVAYFASTCQAEIELYGRGRKIISEISCAPCYKKICPIDEQCMKDMRVSTILNAVKDILK